MKNNLYMHSVSGFYYLYIYIFNQYTTQELLLYNIYLYACKTVVFIIIYSYIKTTVASIELTFGLILDQNNLRSNWLDTDSS